MKIAIPPLAASLELLEDSEDVSPRVLVRVNDAPLCMVQMKQDFMNVKRVSVCCGRKLSLAGNAPNRSRQELMATFGRAITGDEKWVCKKCKQEQVVGTYMTFDVNRNSQVDEGEAVLRDWLAACHDPLTAHLAAAPLTDVLMALARATFFAHPYFFSYETRALLEKLLKTKAWLPTAAVPRKSWWISPSH